LCKYRRIFKTIEVNYFTVYRKEEKKYIYIHWKLPHYISQPGQ
jgi:hypothetical protein